MPTKIHADSHFAIRPYVLGSMWILCIESADFPVAKVTALSTNPCLGVGACMICELTAAAKLLHVTSVHMRNYFGDQDSRTEHPNHEALILSAQRYVFWRTLISGEAYRIVALKGRCFGHPPIVTTPTQRQRTYLCITLLICGPFSVHVFSLNGLLIRDMNPPLKTME